MAAAEQPEGAWGNLPFDAAAAIVATLTSLPSHQAQAAFTALRLTSRHWRHGESVQACPNCYIRLQRAIVLTPPSR